MRREPAHVAGQEVIRPLGGVLPFEAERIVAAAEIDRVVAWAAPRDNVPRKIRVEGVAFQDDGLLQPRLHAQHNPSLIAPVRRLNGNLLAAVEIRHVGADLVKHPGDPPADLVHHRAVDVGTVDRKAPDRNVALF